MTFVVTSEPGSLVGWWATMRYDRGSMGNDSDDEIDEERGREEEKRTIKLLSW